jgi:hypothetical protein
VDKIDLNILGKYNDMSDHIKMCIKDDSAVYFYNTHTGCVLKLYFNADYFKYPGMRQIHLAKIPSKFSWNSYISLDGIAKLSLSFDEYLDWVRFWGCGCETYSQFGWAPKIKFFVKYPEIFEGEFCEVLPSLWEMMMSVYGRGKHDDFDLFY